MASAAAWRLLRRRVDRVLRRRRALVRALEARWRSVPEVVPVLGVERLARLKLLDMLAGVPREALLEGLLTHPDLRDFVGLRARAAGRLTAEDLREIDRWTTLDEAGILLGDLLGDGAVRRAIDTVRAEGGWLGWRETAALAARRRAAALLAQREHAQWRRRPLLARLFARRPPSAPPEDQQQQPEDQQRPAEKPARRRRRGLRRVAMALVLLIVAGIVWIDSQLPSIAQMREIIGRPTIEVTVGRDGQIRFGDAVFPVPVPLGTLPPFLLDTLVEKEDHRFWWHIGFDLIGVARALLEHAENGFSGSGGGGSTITQQVSRMVFLNRDETLSRKLREVLLAIKLELLLSKREILALYLNRAHFGKRLNGIEQAARYYFGVNARSLNQYQAAMLIGMLPAPARRNPEDDIEAAHRAAQRTLDLLVARGVLAGAERDALVKTWGGKPLAALRTGDKTVPLVEHRWFSEWTQEEVRALGLKPGQTHRIVLTLDPLAQIYAQLAARRIVEAGLTRGQPEVAILVMSPDGAVRAMVGSSQFAENQNNYVVSAHRPAASTFKLFVYLAALEAGMSPDDPVEDSPITVDGKPWPRNFTGRYYGQVALGDALADSLNAATVRVADSVGLDKVRSLAMRLGIASPLPEGPSLALGAGGVTPLELTAAYAVLPNDGYRPAPHGIVAVQRADGGIAYWRTAPPRGARVLDDEEIRTMTAMLREVMRRGTGRDAAFAAQVAGKTGTSQDNRDAWFVGYTGDLVASIWVGRADNAPMGNVTASSFVAKKWGNLMSNIYDEQPLPPLPGVER